MKYRHQYHAGNFADVHKHVLLLEVLRALTRKDKGLLFVDTHAGRGDYDLHPGDREHPAEWQAGVARLLAAAPRHAALGSYREIIERGMHGGSLRYPGSPLLAVGALRPVDRIQAVADREGVRGLLQQAQRIGLPVFDLMRGFRCLVLQG